MKRLIWLLLLVSTVGCTSVKAIPPVDSTKKATQDLEFEMALKEAFQTSHQEEMSAIQSQADILARIEASVASVDAKLQPSSIDGDTSDTENGTKPVETDPNTSNTTTEPLNDGSKVTETLPEEREDYVVMFTADWCGACQLDKATTIPDLQRQGVKIYTLDVEDPRNTFWKAQVSSLPTYWVVDGATGIEALNTSAVRSRHVGRMLAKDLRTAARQAKRNGVQLVAPTSSGPCSSQCVCGCTTGGSCNCNSRTQTYSAPVNQVQYGNRMYSGRVCNSPNCRMCNQIQRALQYQPMSIQLQPTTPKVEPMSNPAQEPTPDVTLKHMIDLLKLTDKDVLADLGCGDGRILIEAVNRYGCNAIGVEIDPVKAKEARDKVYAAGLASKIEIITGDALDFEPSEHGVTALTTYLYPELLAKLKSKFDSVRIGASPFHQVPGLAMTNRNDVWIYQPSI